MHDLKAQHHELKHVNASLRHRVAGLTQELQHRAAVAAALRTEIDKLRVLEAAA